MPPHTTQSSAAVPSHREKSTLFCPGCGHTSPADGDWQVEARADRVVYDCPDCDDTITERPTWDNCSQAHRSATDDSLLVHTVRLAFTLTTWPCTAGARALR